MKKGFFLYFIFAMFLDFSAYAQEDLNFEFSCEVSRVYPAISITETQLENAETIVDLNRHFRPSWVREYHSVKIYAITKGEEHKVEGKDFLLTEKQKELLQNADDNTSIKVIVEYTPENTLKNNEPKEYTFSFIVDPNQEASYPKGGDALKKFMQENVVNKISLENFKINQLTAVTFTVTEEGQIDNVKVFESSNDSETDALLVEAICMMPRWNPASYKSGLKVNQDFALTLGDMRSCVINLLNIRPRKVEDY